MTQPRPASQGELTIVGTGIQLGRHISRRALSEIERADVVLGITDAFAYAWLKERRPDLINLAEFYGDGKDRRVTYREMEAAILAPVFAGKRVCAVLYGHPGVFADVSHGAMRKAREAGCTARMEAGVSAEACLYADLDMDPGRRGVLSFEATQFLIYQHVPDPSALLILWQVALCGDLSCTRFDTTPDRLGLLVDKLTRWYPADAEVVLYEAAQLPVQRHRADWLRLADLPDAGYLEHTTLVIPPVRALAPDEEMCTQAQQLSD